MKVAAGLALAGVVMAAIGMRTAGADPDPRRKVAVLEYRAGSRAMPEVDDRLARLLAARTSLAVVTAVDARKRYGNVDAEVVSCAGDTACVAKLGAKLGAAEVLLVGISELGDVILTLQRIDVKRRQVAARLADSLAVTSTPTDAELARYLERLMPESDFLRYGVIHINADVDGAEVEIGGESRGTTPVPSLRVRAPASYDIRVSKEGFVPFRAQVAVPPEGEVRVRAELSRRAAASHWYQKWWVPVVAGAVVVGAGATTFVLLTDDPSSVPVSGRID